MLTLKQFFIFLSYLPKSLFNLYRSQAGIWFVSAGRLMFSSIYFTYCDIAVCYLAGIMGYV